MRYLIGLLAAVVLAGFAGAAAAQTQNPNVLVTASFGDSNPATGEDEHITITCRGVPTCVGTIVSYVRKENCSNYFTKTSDITVTGLDLDQSGPIQGTISLTHFDTNRLANGACEPGQESPELLTYVGTWNLAAQTANVTTTSTRNGDMTTFTLKVDITAPPPVFDMTVEGEVGPVTSTIDVKLHFRPQDIGRNGNVYAFASAPATRVHAVTAKAVRLGMSRPLTKADAPAPCVLAQYSPSSNQLIAVSAAQLTAFVSGAFSAAGAAVSILDHTPTPPIAGATFYVGYGSTGSDMINNGIFRNAVLIPGDSVCPPLPYTTALWWNPAESGWGLNLDQQGAIVFATLFTYDASRNPLWLVMSGGALQSDGLSFSGDLFRTTGSAFNATPFTPLAAQNVSKVGTMTVSFTDVNAGTLQYSVNGVSITKSIQRQVYGSRAGVCLPTTDSAVGSTDYQDLWWNPSESGWGINLTHQDNTLFATLFTYAPGAGNANAGMWLVMSNGARQADGSYFGDLFHTTGSPFNAVPFLPLVSSDITNVGTMRLRFADGNTGTLTYTYNGTTVTKAITRQTFSSPVSACN